MSAEHVGWAFRQDAGSPTRKLVLVALADRVNKDSLLCCPYIETLAADCNLGERAVRDALKGLCDAGLISRTRARRADGALSGYRYHFPDLQDPAPLPAGDAGRDADLPAADAAGLPAADAGLVGNREVPNREENPSNPTPSVADATVEQVGHELPDYDPLKGKRVHGRNLPWDALVEETVSHGKANEARVGAALKSIREEAWAAAQTTGMTLVTAREVWDMYEAALAAEIRRRVRWLKAEKPDLTWGAEGVARWWSRIPDRNATDDAVAEAVDRVRAARQA